MSEEQKIKARERAKKYYYEHKEQVLARQKEYSRKKYHEDEEYRKRTLENHKRYELNNYEKVKKIKREAQKKYYQKHKEYYKEKCGGWYKTKCENLQSKIDKANEILNKLCIYGYGQVNCRPIKNTTKQEVYNAMYEIKNVLKED